VYDTLEVYKSVTDTLVIPVSYTHLDETEVTELKVYPNPTKDELHIALEIIEDFGNHQIRIVNSGGEKVFYGMMDQSKMSLSLADLGPKGMYYLQILNDAGRIVESRKILLE
jgi:hypothetical protein